MAENTNICNPLQYLLEVDEQNTWVVRDIAAPSSNNIIILLLQKDKESRIAIYQTDQKGFQHKEYICQDVEWTDSPLLLSSIYVEDSLNTLICTEKQLFSYDNETLAIRESVPLSGRPMAICVDRSNIFVSAAKTNKITVFNPSFQKEREHKMTCIGISESLTDIVVTFKSMYACTTNGKAFWYDLNRKEKIMEYRNTRTQHSKAHSITLYKGRRIQNRLVFIIWSEHEIHVYSSHSGQTLFAIDVNSSKKIRLTTTKQLIAVEANNAAIYDMKIVIDRAIFLSIFVSSAKSQYREDFIGLVLQDQQYKTSDSSKKQLDKTQRRSEKSAAGTFDFQREQLREIYAMYEHSLEKSTTLAKSIEEKDQAIDELQVQLKDQENKMFGLPKTLDEDSYQVEQTNEELNLVKNENEVLREKLVNIETENSNVKQELNSKMQNINKLRSTNMKLEKQVQETEAKLHLQERKTEEAVDRFGTMQSDLKEVRNENEVLREKVVNMETENLSVKQEFNSQMETLNKLRSTNMILEKQVQETEAKLQLQERKTEEAVDRFGTMQSDLKELRNMTLEKKVEETEEKLKLQEAMKMFGTMQSDLKEVKSNISKLLQGNEGIATAAEELKKDLAGLSQTRRILQKESGASTSSEDSGRSSLQSIAAIEKAVRLYNESDGQKYRLANNFQSSKIITKDGGRVDIKGTDVSLLVPPGALLGDCEIHIQLITGNLETGKDVNFASNSAAIVELTPDNFEFQTAVELQLPHCLQLKENFTNESVEVLTSHHDPKASPYWERDTEVKFELQEESCRLYLKKFCWVTFRINNEIVEAKRLKIFTVGSKVIDTDSETTVHVGYFPDVPGNEDIFIDENITVGQFKPFWFKKEEPTPLIIFLKYLTPSEWKNTADESRKEISYQDIASSKNRSCDFVLRCITSVRRSGLPYATFRVYRQHDSTNITFRPKMWNDLSEDEDS